MTDPAISRVREHSIRPQRKLLLSSLRNQRLTVPSSSVSSVGCSIYYITNFVNRYIGKCFDKYPLTPARSYGNISTKKLLTAFAADTAR